MRDERVQFRGRLQSVRIASPAEPLSNKAPVAPAPASSPPAPAKAVAAGAEADQLPGIGGRHAGSQEAAPDHAAEWAQIETTFAALDERLQEVEHRRKESLVEMQQAAVELAISVASRLVHEKIEAGDFAVEELVSQLLKRCEGRGPAVVRLHPADLKLLEQRTQGKPPPWLDQKTYTLTADGSLERGDCRLEAGDFGILAKIELQLSELRQHLLECLDDAQIERRRTQAGNRSLRRFPDRRETA